MRCASANRIGFICLRRSGAATASTYHKFCEFLKGLKVTNDVVERACKLIEDFISTLRKYESQLQALLQVVEAQRRQFLDSKMLTLYSM